jgi:tripartite-type tricarboxylate transporter receptor subunit TctC
MKFNRRVLLTYGAATLAAPMLHAQTKPPIRVLVGFPPGGGTDAIVRAVIDRLPALLGQPVIVDNKPGAGGRIAADAMLAAPADGLTFMAAPSATPTFQTLVFGHELKWNILKDFTPVAMLVSYPLGMGVAQNVGAKNVREFVEWARKNPGKASVGTPGLGGQNAFLGFHLAKTMGLELPVIPYKGTPPMVTDLVGGQVPAAISLLDAMMPHHRAGRIHVIGIFTKQRSPLIPDIPTFAEQGVDVTSGEGWTGMWARAGTPAAEVQRMQDAVRQALQLPEVKDTLTQKLLVQPDFRPGAELDTVQRAELDFWAPIVKASGYKPE